MLGQQANITIATVKTTPTVYIDLHPSMKDILQYPMSAKFTPAVSLHWSVREHGQHVAYHKWISNSTSWLEYGHCTTIVLHHSTPQLQYCNYSRGRWEGEREDGGLNYLICCTLLHPCRTIWKAIVINSCCGLRLLLDKPPTGNIIDLKYTKPLWK